MKIKEVLKKNKVIFNLNAKNKAIKLKNDSKVISEMYDALIQEHGINYCSSDVPNLVKQRISKHVKNFKSEKGALRILWVGTNEAQDTSGFLQALEKYGEVHPFINSDGSYGIKPHTKKGDKQIIKDNSNELLNQVKNINIEEGPIDILIGQMLSNQLSVEVLKQIQGMGIITINIAMDDRLPSLWQKHEGTLLGSVGLSDGLDLVLTTSPECCSRYLVHGCPAIYWPLASDPELFKPSSKKDIDVCFIGNKYGIREKLVKSLEKKGIEVMAYGRGWENGSVDSKEAAEIFGRSKIILGIGTIGYTVDMFTLKLRDFDATMAGALYITHRNPDLINIFEEGKEIECYLNITELVEKVSYYLNNEKERSKIAKLAYEKARKYHTWERRLSEAFEIIGVK